MAAEIVAYGLHYNRGISLSTEAIQLTSIQRRRCIGSCRLHPHP
jgi:hypothetical protein